MLNNGLDRKQAFQDDKNTNFVKSEKWVFSKGVNSLFWWKKKTKKIILVYFLFKLAWKLCLVMV